MGAMLLTEKINTKRSWFQRDELAHDMPSDKSKHPQIDQRRNSSSSYLAIIRDNFLGIKSLKDLFEGDLYFSLRHT